MHSRRKGSVTESMKRRETRLCHEAVAGFQIPILETVTLGQKVREGMAAGDDDITIVKRVRSYIETIAK